MATITIYRDDECTEILGSGIVGEYSDLNDISANIKQETQTFDGTTYRYTQGFDCLQSTVKRYPEPTLIPLTVYSNSRQYFYFNPRFRCAYYQKNVSTSTKMITSFSYQVLQNGTWYNIAAWAEQNATGYKFLGIRFRSSPTLRRQSAGTTVTGGFIGFDLVFESAQGQTTERRAFMVINHFDFLMSLSSAGGKYTPKTGNTTKRAGTGTGYYPNNPVPALPTSAINAAFANVLGVGNGLTYYKLTGDCLAAITEFLYDTTLSLKFRNSTYRDAIASLVFIPYNVQPDRINTKRTIYLASRGIYPNDSCDFITTPLREIDFGEINLIADTVGYKTFADFTLTSATLYLPCYGAVNLDMHSIANGILHLRAVIDVRNGNILYRLETQAAVDDLPVLYGQYSGNCGIPVPVGGANASATVLGAVTSIGTVATGIATANPVTAVAGMAGLISEVVPYQTAPSIDKSGALQPAAAAYGTPVPVLQIMKKIMLAPPEWGTVNGFLSGGKDGETEYKLSDFTGYFRAAACDVSGIDGATEQEKQQIKSLLESGVYL